MIQDQMPQGPASHVIKFIGIPTAKLQIEAANHVLSNMLVTEPWGTQNSDEDLVRTNVEGYFDLPYGQGGGFTVIEFTSIPVPNTYATETGEDMVTPPSDDHKFTKVTVLYGYSDSMTSPHHANVWFDTKLSSFETEAM